jgi:hypothetical protein
MNIIIAPCSFESQQIFGDFFTAFTTNFTNFYFSNFYFSASVSIIDSLIRPSFILFCIAFNRRSVGFIAIIIAGFICIFRVLRGILFVSGWNWKLDTRSTYCEFSICRIGSRFDNLSLFYFTLPWFFVFEFFKDGRL